MVYTVDIKTKQQELAVIQELVKDPVQSFLHVLFSPITVGTSNPLLTPATPEVYSEEKTISRLKILGQRRLAISLNESHANYDLLGTLLDRVRFFILHRKDLFEDVDPELVNQSAFDFFELAVSCKHKAAGSYEAASNLIEDETAEELRKIKEKRTSLENDFDNAARDIRHARYYRKFISEHNPNYHERYWTYPEDVQAAYGDHLFMLGNAFTNAAFLEAQRVENLADYIHLIDKSHIDDEAWKTVLQRMRGGFIREGRPSAETVPKLLTMAGDAYATALKFTSY